MCLLVPGREIREGQSGDQPLFRGEKDLACPGESGGLPVGNDRGLAGMMGSLHGAHPLSAHMRADSCSKALVLPVPGLRCGPADSQQQLHHQPLAWLPGRELRASDEGELPAVYTLGGAPGSLWALPLPGPSHTPPFRESSPGSLCPASPRPQAEPTAREVFPPRGLPPLRGEHGTLPLRTSRQSRGGSGKWQ